MPKSGPSVRGTALEPRSRVSPKVALRSDGLQRNPEAETSRKMRQNHSKGILNIVTAITIEERIQ